MSAVTPPPVIDIPTPIVIMSPVVQPDPWGIPLLLVVLAALLIVLIGRRRGTWLTAGLLLFGFDVARLNMTGVALLGVIFIAVAGAMWGVFTRDFWVAPSTPAGAAEAPDLAHLPQGAAVPAGHTEGGAR